jgi:DNA-binding SARP family transcriptional activator
MTQKSTSVPTASRVILVGAAKLQTASGRTWPLESNDAALLVMLATGQETSRIRLAGLLWPEADEKSQIDYLRQRRHRLREKNHSEVIEKVGDDELVLSLPHDLQDPRAAFELDPLAKSGELISSANFSKVQAELAEMIEIARIGWRQTRRIALTQCALHREAQRQWEEALPYRARLCRDDPLDESAHLDVIRGWRLCGELEPALAACKAAREFLGDHPRIVAAQTQVLADMRPVMAMSSPARVIASTASPGQSLAPARNNFGPHNSPIWSPKGITPASPRPRAESGSTCGRESWCRKEPLAASRGRRLPNLADGQSPPWRQIHCARTLGASGAGNAFPWQRCVISGSDSRATGTGIT